MRSNRNMRQQHTFLSITLLTIAFAFLLASCGANTSTSTGSAPDQPPTAAATIQKGYGAGYGCPSDAVVSTAPAKANITLQQSDINSTVTAHAGNIIEVRLPFGHKWTGPVNMASILAIQQPTGYAWKSDKVCIWRFLVTGTGTAPLNFQGSPICKPNEMCAMYIMIATFTIKVM